MDSFSGYLILKKHQQLGRVGGFKLRLAGHLHRPANSGFILDLLEVA